MANPVTIPGPAGYPMIGNLADVDPSNSIESLGRLADTYGEIFKLNLLGEERLFISSQALVNEICDEKRFEKKIGAILMQVRNGLQDGLFTARPGEHNWEVAHRVLMPAFGPLSMRDMFDEMHDIASQLVVKWARFGRKEKINVTDDFTRLTLDSIALCAMDTRFNSYYKDEMHPFVNAMVGFLAESGSRENRPPFVNYFMRTTQAQYDADIALLVKVAGEVVAERRAHPSDKKDLLNAMIKGRDPKTGEGLADQSILNNMITFLIAGHETTSGMLSFLFYFLLKSPLAYQAAQAEVEKVIGKGPITVEHMSQLPYITACLRETLRLTPTAPAFELQMRGDSTDDHTYIGGGKYKIEKGQAILALLPNLHRDPAVYGDDAADFKPERMLDEPFAALPPNAWKPFGNGMRSCIGRPFAWQEALLVVAMLLQNFNFRFDNSSYTLSIKQTLTIKPKDFYMHATLKEHIDPVYLEKSLHVNSWNGRQPQKVGKTAEAVVSGKPKEPMAILYGSNSGTCEALAQSFARVAAARGYLVQVDSLDSAVDNIPKGQPVVMISSSYEGQPPDNAAHFVAWLDNMKSAKQLDGVKYAVYGCGNRDWASTFHKVPKGLDSAFELHGARRFASMGLGDVAAGDIFNDFDKWQDESFWPGLGGGKEDVEDESGVDIEIDTSSRRSTLRQDVREAIVISNEVLTGEGVPEKRHIALKLPTGVSYKVGDYLAVLPINNSQTIRRVLKRFGLPWDAVFTIKSGSNTTLPTGHPVSAMEILGAYVELVQPATRRNVQRIARTVPDEKGRETLLRMAGPDFEAQVGLKRLSPLDILEAFPAAALPLADFLAMLPPMRIRQYSISSSHLADSTVATLTWSVLDTPSKADGGKRYLGVASNYLSNLEEGDRVHIAVKPSHGTFHPPNNVENTPVIMLCAGSGIAPFRGFVQERSIHMKAGRKLAPAYLFVGCSLPGKDELFKEEFANWEKERIVKVFYAYSKAKDRSKGSRYVQERLWEEKVEMTKAFNDGAKIYICGSASVGDGVTTVIKRIYADSAEGLGHPLMEEEVEEWFKSIKADRYASDVFV
ncbi:hypothetical protein V500_00823 [Pseudogymnoascus sp. VKM F-4518 (FW-2643)]|nr:hypothetical protein V500_00823 [Pseudogymnoascus sp. VKM F-4518 (FW-2643)]